MFESRLFQEKDIAPLAVYRILMGLLMSAEGFGAIITGWVGKNYVDVPFAFHFIGFDFLDILVGPQAYAVYLMLGLSGLGVAFGYRYRVSIFIYTVLWAAVYFGQKSSYNNHYFLLLIICVMMNFVPAHHFASLDVRQGRVSKCDIAPRYAIDVFKWLLLIVYFYAALAKIYPDWLSGRTVGIFLSNKGEGEWITALFTSKFFILIIAYGGIVFDFLVIPALWYKPTRIYAFIVSIGFHLFNSIVFHIGIFPYMMLISAVLFFESTTIRKLFFRGLQQVKNPIIWVPKNKKLVKISISAFFILMLALPLRHFFYPGCVHWTEEGHRMAWHMMLRSKSGTLSYQLKSSKLQSPMLIEPKDYMSAKMARSMATRPDMIWQFAQRLRRQFEAEGHENVEVYAFAMASLNGRPYERLIDSGIDLANAPRNYFCHNDWILLHPSLNEKHTTEK
jgi:hypothetical protein